jgi:hypothetical protein
MTSTKTLLGFFFCVLAILGCEETQPPNEIISGRGDTAMKTPDSGLTDMGDDDATSNDAAQMEDSEPAVNEQICDGLDPAACTLPWPSNRYLVADGQRTTGYTLDFGEESLPANQNGHVDPSLFERMDGYGLGVSVMTLFADLDASMLPNENQVAASMESDAAILWFEVEGRELLRVPYWTELDSQETDTTKKLLFVRPAVVLKEATRYVVAFRNLQDNSGQPFAARDTFSKLVASETADDPELAARQAHFDEVFSLLGGAGIEAESLIVGWDFVTASSDGLHSNLLHMRDEALETVGEDGPELVVTEVSTFTEAENQYIALDIQGTMEVPHYMKPLSTGIGDFHQFNWGEDGKPEQNGTTSVPFWVRVPHTALTGSPHGIVLYGHGLLGSGSQVRGGFNSKIAHDHELIFFAADLAGMSEPEYAGAIQIVANFSLFPLIADRLHQGMLDWVLLTRAMRERFTTLDIAVANNIQIDKEQVYYSGISQGGIFGGTFVAISPDVTRGHLGVPGHNYSILLHRSKDFDPFFAIMRATYPAPIDQAILLSAAQLLWDGTDPVSYYRRLSENPFPGHTAQHVLLAPAKGDYQVAVIQNEVVARSNLGIALMKNYDDERVIWGLEETPYPHSGSGVVLYDFDDAWPEPGNHVPAGDFGGNCDGSNDCPDGYRCSDSVCSHDPHGKPRYLDHHNQQMVQFLRTGTIIDVCGDDGCHPD